MILNSNHFDGFLPRFLVATPEEEYVTMEQKISASKRTTEVDIQLIFDKIFNLFFENGHTFELDDEALKIFSTYHDKDVLEFRKTDVFEDVKSMIKSKSIGNLLRTTAIQCALRVEFIFV